MAGDGDRRSLKVFPATPNEAIEATASHLVLDEWAHTFDPEALWTAVEPTLSGRATSALITTARTPGDFVHDYGQRFLDGKTRTARSSFPLWSAPTGLRLGWNRSVSREAGRAACGTIRSPRRRRSQLQASPTSIPRC